MTSEQLRATRDAIPFQPFVIHMTDGRSFRIHHRDYLYIFPSGRVALVARSEGNAGDLIDVMLITGLALEETSTPMSGTPTNGLE